MKRVIIWDYIRLGTSVRYLQDVKDGYSIHSVHGVKDNIARFLEEVERTGLPVTLRAASDLSVILSNFEGRSIESVMTVDDAIGVGQEMTNIRLTLSAEARGIEALLVSDKNYTVKKLTDDIWSLFRPEAYAFCPEIAKLDFEEAGKLIAYERPTAAAFHMMRGLEDVLKKYYCRKVRSNRAALMWGPMVASLRSINRPPPVELLDHLDNIRRNFRNPTQHPEKVYDLREAQDLLSVSIDVVNRISLAR